jgi:chromosome segregation ATPase
MIKLNVEIETLRSNTSKSKIDLFDITKPNLQTVLKSVQNSLNDFKERIEKLDKNNSNLSENNFVKQSTQEIENKIKIWIEEIKNYKEEELKKINENYENNLKKSKEQIEELSFEITKKNYIIEEKTEMKNTFDIKINESKNQIQQLNEMIQSKEDVIKNKDDCLKAFNDKIETHKTRIEDLEVQLNSNIINLKMKEVELESVIEIISFIAEKKKEKDKIKKALSSISSENQEYIIKLLKKMGLIK